MNKLKGLLSLVSFVRSFTKGWKTHSVSWITVVGAAVAMFTGVLPVGTALTLIFGGTLSSTFRAALETLCERIVEAIKEGLTVEVIDESADESTIDTGSL